MVEQVTEEIISNVIIVDHLQFGFMLGGCLTNAIFIVRSNQQKFIQKNQNLFFIFVDLEESFGRVPRKVLWWVLQSVDMPECLVLEVHIIYQNTKSQFKVNCS